MLSILCHCLADCYHAKSVKNRRSLTQSDAPGQMGDLHATRRCGARHGVSARVSLRPHVGVNIDGWALNISRGGIRLILEESVELGAEFDITFPTAEASAAAASTDVEMRSRHGRIVWVQEEPDGVVVGMEFRDG